MSTAAVLNIPKSGATSTPHGQQWSVVVFSKDEAIKQLVEHLNANHFTCQDALSETVTEANKRLAGRGLELPDIVIIDLSDCANAIEEATTMAYHCKGEVKLIGVGEENSLQFYRDLMLAGFADYIPKPVVAEKLNEVMETVALGQSHGKSRSKTIVFTGARGGVGCSSLAVNSAWLMAEKHHRHTVLLDLDPYFGTLSLALDVEPSTGFIEAIRNPDRIDDLFVNSALAKAGEHLYVMGVEENLANHLEMSERTVDPLLHELSKNFEYIVIDLPRHALHLQKNLLDRIDELHIVTDLSLFGIRDTIRLMAHAKHIREDCRFKIIANRVGAGKDGELTKEEFEKAVNQTITVMLPEDSGNCAFALNNGKALAEASPDSKVVKELSAYCAEIVGAPKTQKKNSILSWILD